MLIKYSKKTPLTKIILRKVLEFDLPILFQQQLEPDAIAMSAYPSKDRGEFMRHWDGILKNKAITARTIIYKDKIAGHILCWKEKYEQRVGYWIGKQFWGRGIATSALTELVREVKTRPLYAQVANHNLASKRVLEKCGFVGLDEGIRISVFKLE